VKKGEANCYSLCATTYAGTPGAIVPPAAVLPCWQDRLDWTASPGLCLYAGYLALSHLANKQFYTQGVAHFLLTPSYHSAKSLTLKMPMMESSIKNSSSLGATFSNENNVSCTTWYSDGIPVFKSMKYTVYPLINNELPYENVLHKKT